MLRQFLVGGGVAVINIAIHALMMSFVIGVAQAAQPQRFRTLGFSWPPS